MFQKQIAVQKKQEVVDSQNTSIKYFLWRSRKNLSEVLNKSGAHKESEKNIRISLEIIENLLAQSPDDFGYHRNSAITHIQYGKFLIDKKNYSQAIREFRRAAELTAPIVENDMDNAEAKHALAAADANLGEISILQGNKKEGLTLIEKAVEIFNSINAPETLNAEMLEDFRQTTVWLNAANENSKK